MKLLLRLAVLLAVAAGILMLTGNLIAAKVIEAGVGAPVSVGRLQIDLFQSRFGIYNLKIHNPSGFTEPQLAAVPEIFIHLDFPALLKNRVHIHEIRLNLDQITIERNKENKVNVAVIGALKKKEPAPAPQEGGAPSKPDSRPGEPAKAPPAPQVTIDKVILSLGRARYVNNNSPQTEVREFPLEIRDSVLTNVTDPAQITQQIVVKTLQKVGLNALLPNLDQFSAGFGTQLSAKAEEIKEMFAGLKQKMGGT